MLNIRSEIWRGSLILLNKKYSILNGNSEPNEFISYMSFSGSISRNDKGQRDMSDKGLNWPGWSEEIFQTNICEKSPIPAGIYLFKINNRNTRTICEIYSMLTIKTPKRRQWRRSGLFIVNYEQNSHIFLVFPLLILNKCRQR